MPETRHENLNFVFGNNLIEKYSLNILRIIKFLEAQKNKTPHQKLKIKISYRYTYILFSL